jgi:tetratricopeptide (TPR) repeat protein
MGPLGNAVRIAACFGASAVALYGQCDGQAPYDCAVAFVQKQEFDRALRILDGILAKAPADLRALNLSGIALTGAGKIEKADERFRQALKIDPRFYPSLKNLAVNEFTLKHFDTAKLAFEEFLRASPSDEVAHVSLGEIAFRRKDMKAALLHYEQSRTRVDQSPVAALHYAECLATAGRTTDAIAALAPLPATDPDIQFEAGVVLGKAGAFREAAKAFALAKAGTASPYTAAYNQILMLIRATDYSGAIDLFSELTRQGLRRAELYNLISEAHLKSGRIEQAYNSLRTATELEPEAEDNYVDLAGICLDYENYDLGLEIVDIGLRRLPKSYRLRLHHGVMLAQKGLAEESERDFELAGALSPTESLPYAALAMAWMQRGETERAVRVLRDRVKRNPRDFMLPYILGIALVRSGAEPRNPMGVEARSAYETSIRLNPRFSRAHAELGKLLLKGGDVAGSIAQLQQAVELDPDDGAAAYQLAQAYRKKGDNGRSQEMLSRVTRLRDRKEGLDANAEMKRIVREGVASAAPSVAR